MRFRKLRLTGFKSFVEPSELPIEPGLTGIVGPNGCGKSNLLEALRWVMGENSHKSMRASAMDDVIFSGSSSRPARVMAEVTLTLDNSSHAAPPPWRQLESIEVSRRILREKGSTYRINGREVRARDVQLLFADAGTGARSPALVRQGRVAELINARPQARRRLLEEAAGIAGLHARRHEAELKLNAAEQNLLRLDDVMAQLRQQVGGLTRQARQAARYRELSGSIREHERALLWRLWREAAQHHAQAEGAVAAAIREQGEAAHRASLFLRELELLRGKLAPLRERAAERGAAVQRLRLELEGLDRRERAAERRRQESEEHLRQTGADLARLAEDVTDAEAALARLAEEERALKEQDVNGQRREVLAQALQEARAGMAKWQERLDAARQRLAELAAEGGALKARLDELDARHQRLQAERARQEQRLQALGQQRADADLAHLQEQVERTARAEHEAEERLQALMMEESALREQVEKARTRAHQCQRQADALRAEIRAIEKMLQPQADAGVTRLIDVLQVESGFEKALAAALGEDMEAALEEDAAVHWRLLPAMDDLPPLPAAVVPLSGQVRAPAALARRLAAIGVVESAAAGHALQPALKPGQRLVSRDGDVWRWDGFVAAAEAPTAAARRLQARNRLGRLQGELEQAETAQEEAEARLAGTRKRLKELQQRLEEARNAARHARAAHNDARRQLERQRAAHEEVLRQETALRATLKRLDADITALAEERRQVQAALSDLPSTDGLEAEIAQLRERLQQAQEKERKAHLALQAAERAAREQQARQQRIARERADWQRRLQRAARHRRELSQRLQKLRQELAELKRAPETLAEERRKLRQALREAERQAREAADAQAEAETAVLEKEHAWRAAEEALAQARAALAAARAHHQAAGERLGEILDLVRTRAGTRPQHLLAGTGWTEDDCPGREQLEAALEKARTARERLGAVNLRAEDELQTAREELERLLREREDVQQAVNRLRGAISTLNREGRKRLLAAFDRVNEHFAALFATLFGGGRAHLELVESDDPLDAGLEIFAQPPGKRLQTLSLLSGGEQTLTALALIFAVFLVNPSPVCVLDEVDAPLDEHNVERFCNLLDDMLKRAPTDFLIITHHPLTMSRMHRLFGVTMMEPGVSRIVSVDLETAERLREAS